jgi:hypothetical protein
MSEEASPDSEISPIPHLADVYPTGIRIKKGQDYTNLTIPSGSSTSIIPSGSSQEGQRNVVGKNSKTRQSFENQMLPGLFSWGFL